LTEEASTEMVEHLRERQRTELYKVPILAEQMVESKAEEHVPIVFVSFRDTLHNLHKELAGFGQIGTIYGGQPDWVREDVLAQAAQDKFDALILTIDAGGVGVNLQARPGMRMRVSYISPTFKSWAAKQAVGRIHRTGGQRSIQTFVMLAGTVEERVYARMKNKLATLDAFNTLEDADLIGL
jgi:SNF2 family DNA or RNA helicase